MNVTSGRLLAVVVAVGAGWALLAWPILNDVETGKTRQYDDLTPRRYRSSLAATSKAVEQTLGATPGFRLVGGGSGRGGAEFVAQHSFGPLVEELTIRIQSKEGGSLVSVRSRSSYGPADFGQNARNIRAFLAALDARLRAARAGVD